MRNINEFIAYCDESVAMESNIKDTKNILSYLQIFYEHMLKWRYQPNHRSKSWRGSIQNARNKIFKMINGHSTIFSMLTEDKIYSSYIKGLKSAAKETGMSIKEFPCSIPEEWIDLNKILDDMYFIDYMKMIEDLDPRGIDFDIENYFILK